MNYSLEDTVMEELERAVCRLESMGTILASLCAPDQALPDLSSLADLGSLISRQSMDVLSLLAEKEPLKPASIVTVVHEDDHEADAPMPRIWFIPEIPSD